MSRLTVVLLMAGSAAALAPAQADEVYIPRRQSQPPGPPLSPQQALAKMVVPEGLEEQMTQQEMADLFALLSLEQPPEAADNQVIVGTPKRLHEQP